MTKNDLAKKVFKSCYLTGEFKLRSGQISNEYFDKYQFESQPELLREVVEELAKLIPKNIEVLAGLEMGGIPIATALSLKTGIPLCFVRKKAKDYGTCRFAEGTPIQGRRVLIVEDVITTGGQVLLSTDDLRSDGAIVEDVLCVIYRGPKEIRELKDKKLSLTHLFTKEELTQS